MAALTVVITGLLLVAFSGTTGISLASNQTILVPSLPTEHLLCWLRNLSSVKVQRLLNACRNDSSANFTKLNLSEWTVVDLQTVDGGGGGGGGGATVDQIRQQLCPVFVRADNERSKQKLPCWGYETDSNEECLLYKPVCTGNAQSWAPNKVEQLKIFFNTADFGYVRQRRNELERYCQPNQSTDKVNSSELWCAKYMRYCNGRNIYINFRRLRTLQEPIRYREDVLEYGDIGGWSCTLDRAKLLREGDHKSPLMSWFAEIANFKAHNYSSRPRCDITIDKPVFIMKLDASVNMYHHLCDFINLYTSMHLNGSHFALDNQILLWDSIPYRSNFAPLWRAFTRNPLLTLANFTDKQVCFREVIFPLLPRMIYGLYYNMPLIPGCSGSGLFRAFNRHLLHHLGLKNSTTEQLSTLAAVNNDRIPLQVTFISRSTKYRKVLNQKQLITALRTALDHRQDSLGPVTIQEVDFNFRMPFEEQIAISSQTDLLIGMHGAGLTHTLMQPDYGALFELYNCEDPDCYRDLARLRGTHYLTWKNESTFTVFADDSAAADRKAMGKAHAKFVNYHFDPVEFVKLTLEAIENVQTRKRLWFAGEVQKNFHWSMFNVDTTTTTTTTAANTVPKHESTINHVEL